MLILFVVVPTVITIATTYDRVVPPPSDLPSVSVVYNNHHIVASVALSLPQVFPQQPGLLCRARTWTHLLRGCLLPPVVTALAKLLSMS